MYRRNLANGAQLSLQ